MREVTGLWTDAVQDVRCPFPGGPAFRERGMHLSPPSSPLLSGIRGNRDDSVRKPSEPAHHAGSHGHAGHEGRHAQEGDVGTWDQKAESGPLCPLCLF